MGYPTICSLLYKDVASWWWVSSGLGWWSPELLLFLEVTRKLGAVQCCRKTGWSKTGEVIWWESRYPPSYVYESSWHGWSERLWSGTSRAHSHSSVHWYTSDPKYFGIWGTCSGRGFVGGYLPWWSARHFSASTWPAYSSGWYLCAPWTGRFWSRCGTCEAGWGGILPSGALTCGTQSIPTASAVQSMGGIHWRSTGNSRSAFGSKTASVASFTTHHLWRL